MKKFKLGVYGIVVEVAEDSGSIISDLHEDGEPDEWKSAMDALESIILAHACAGIDISTPAYLEGIETAVDACSNNLLGFDDIDEDEEEFEEIH